MLLNNLPRCGMLVPAFCLALAAPSLAAKEDDSESTLRRNIAWQIALDRVGFSPGLIDGRQGGKTELATREFQRVHGMPQTGQLDKATADALQVAPQDILGKYTVTQDDLSEVGPNPTSWLAKSKLDRLGHECLSDALCEKFHCTHGLLQTLNPGVSLDTLKPGSKLIVPILPESTGTPVAHHLEVNLSEKVIRVMDAQDRLVAMFYCSIAKDKAKLPSGQTRVECVAQNPDYMFKPEMWPEVREKITQKLRIPPGPRNPVGRCWVGLGLPGYGMHGTPNPELIGKTGSHGCFRLTNWDAVRLGRMVKPGIAVKFSAGPALQLARK
jgi:lipoprotein-anchoring transpeptidase ErfK/SrfK